jgi:tight adherence protein B
MRLLAALAAGVCAFIVVAHVTGQGERLRLRLPGSGRPPLSRGVWLRQAGVDVTPLQFWAVSVVVGAAVELVIWAVSGSPFVGLVPAVASGLGPRAYFGRRRAERLRAVVRAWPDGIRHILATTEARTTIHQALLELAATGPEPIAEAFTDYAGMAHLAGPVAALELIREELADPTSDWVIEDLIVAHEQGQAIARQILRELATQISKDLQANDEIKTAQLEPKLTARVAFVIPWLALAAMCASVDTFRSFYRSGAGAAVVALGGILGLGGLALTRYLTRDVSEIRVLGNAEARR